MLQKCSHVFVEYFVYFEVNFRFLNGTSLWVFFIQREYLLLTGFTKISVIIFTVQLGDRQIQVTPYHFLKVVVRVTDPILN